MIVIFTGTRRRVPTEDQFFQGILAASADDLLLSNDITIYVGDAKGVDAYIRKRFPYAKVFKADWERHYKAAGNIRNQLMIGTALENADPKEDIVVIGFPDAKSKGTFNCMNDANRAGIRSVSVPL